MKMGTLGQNSVPEFSAEDEIFIYPNPASSLVTVIASPDALIGAKQSQLFNAYGEKIGNWQLAVGKNEINISNLSNGIYFMKIGNTAKKIVVSK